MHVQIDSNTHRQPCESHTVISWEHLPCMVSFHLSGSSLLLSLPSPIHLFIQFLSLLFLSATPSLSPSLPCYQSRRINGRKLAYQDELKEGES